MAAPKLVTWPDVDSVIIAYSGGKDSLVLLDMAVRRYKRVVPFFMYFLKGLDYNRAVCRFAEQRYNLSVLQYPAPAASEFMRKGLFCASRPDAPKFSTDDVYARVREDTGIQWIGFGYRAQESLERNAMLKRDWPYGLNLTRSYFAPLAWWGPPQLRAYLQSHRLPLPPSCSNRWNDRSGPGLKPDNLAWMRKYWPKDYDRILKVFPYAAYQADRHEELVRANAEANEARKRDRRRQPVSDVPVQGDSPV